MKIAMKKSSSAKIPQLNDDIAGKLLENVFDACEKEPSTIPLETLASYSEYRRERHTFEKNLLIAVFVFLLIIPLAFTAPTVKISLVDPDYALYPTYRVDVESLLPVSFASAAVDGQAVSMYEAGERLYSVTPTISGELTVRVTLLNGQYNTAVIKVGEIDVEAPKVLYSSKTGDRFSVYLDEKGSGIDWDAIGAYTAGGEKIPPLEYDPEEMRVDFRFPDENITILIPDLNGNVLQLALAVADK